MTQFYKEMLKQLSPEQLIYLIEQLEHSQWLIGEVCVDESKRHISSDKAVDKIRGCLYHMPSMHNAKVRKSHIDLKMGKISVSEYRKIMGFDD
jgi:hypothetical protein